MNNYFYSLVKIIAELPHSWQKIVIHGNSCIILYITDIIMQSHAACDKDVNNSQDQLGEIMP